MENALSKGLDQKKKVIFAQVKKNQSSGFDLLSIDIEDAWPLETQVSWTSDWWLDFFGWN